MLRETDPGVYRGTHVVSRNDRIDPLQQMTARLTHGETTLTRAFT